jgi:ATP-dependent Clp protease adaptor protein ClpS
MTDTDVKTPTKTKTKTNLQEPGLYHVIYINDDVTTQEFVIETLVVIFNYSHLDAADITEKIHEEGSAIVATMPYEMAEQKGIEVTLLARNHGFPLSVKVEAE